ncbi:MAG: hypothetical protein DI630_11965 [Gordonia sp. (in: high G+C Gram-positive bacteria)]|nr:MAG: hypothetical protein DI630_11965 [Gordonia sp. (in: high G+C Gram-positive bacteria)]
MNAGARMLEPICGPCVGIGQAPLQGAPSLRTLNRNFPGRSGAAEDQVYLCSPSTAAASALTGHLTDPSGRAAISPRLAQLLTPPSRTVTSATRCRWNNASRSLSNEAATLCRRRYRHRYRTTCAPGC